MEKILKYIITKDCYKNKLNNQIEIDKLKVNMINKYKLGNYSFGNKIKYNLFTQNNKKRVIAEIKNENNNVYDDRCLEYFLSVGLNKLVVNKMKLIFSNRNKVLLGLFNTLKALDQFSDYTIIRFDFVRFFDSICCKYVYMKYLDQLDFTKEQKKCLKEYVASVKHCVAGLPLSNTFAEIIAQDFDSEIRKTFEGVLYYARYVDDGILILNHKLSQDVIKDTFKKIITNVFYDAKFPDYKLNRTKIDYSKKFNYIIRDVNVNGFDYLGYSIRLEDNTKSKLKITLGIAEKKRKKYYNKTKNIIKKFEDKPEKLRIVLKLLSRRIVYTIIKNNSTKHWISKGIIYNYKDLFFFGEKIEHDTTIFLDSLYNKCFSELKMDTPYYLRDSNSKKGYNLLYCLKKNKTFIMDQNIGIKEDNLNDLLRIVSPEYNVLNKKYHEKVKQLLIECKIGY